MFTPQGEGPRPGVEYVYRSLPHRLWLTVARWRRYYRSDRWIGNQAVGALRVSWYTANYPVGTRPIRNEESKP